MVEWVGWWRNRPEGRRQGDVGRRIGMRGRNKHHYGTCCSGTEQNRTGATQPMFLG